MPPGGGSGQPLAAPLASLPWVHCDPCPLHALGTQEDKGLHVVAGSQGGAAASVLERTHRLEAALEQQQAELRGTQQLAQEVRGWVVHE